MREISLQEAETTILNADRSILEPFRDILGPLDARERDIMPYVLNMFINILKFENPRDFVRDAFGYKDRLHRDIEYFKSKLSDGAAVIDVGCGWGGLTRALGQTNSKLKLHAVDYVIEHTIVTKYLCPEARVFQADARDLQLFADATFDVVIPRGVIEHIGDHSVPIGPSGSNIKHQFAFMHELSRITKIGGCVCMSTGNYLHPWDGETGRWFFHWLPPERKEAYKQKRGFGTDRYWLLTWEELFFILKTCGLEVDQVFTDRIERLFENLHRAFDGIDSDMIAEWERLSWEDPAYMPNWWIVAAKRTEPQAPSLTFSNRCYCARASGSCPAEIPGGSSPPEIRGFFAKLKWLLTGQSANKAVS
jgi:hypothetical protein